MNKYLLIVFCLSYCFIVCAQEEGTEEPGYSALSSDSLSATVGLIPESLDANVDSLLHTWHVQYFSKKDDYCHDDVENVFYDDSVYKERLDRLPRVMPLPFNKVVRDCIDLYAGRRRELVRYMLGMADFYFPIIEQILDEHNLPIELKYLAVVESALNPVALSRVGASGIWQFMLPTGKHYGLEINSLVDDRRDPVKATHAACKYFEDMYVIYKDWNLVLAAYNCGPGNVNKAIRRSGGKTDFWDIFPFLPKETRSYVPLFVAANYIMNYYCEHNICPMQTSLPLATDTVMVNNNLHLQQVSDVLQMDIDVLRALNPQYKRDILPGHATSPCVLKLPAVQTYAFIDKEDTVYTHRIEELLANCIRTDASVNSRDDSKENINHVVESGETIYTIANRYGVTAQDIRKWNGLSSSRVAKGKRLKLKVDNGGVTFTTKTSTTQVEAQEKAVTKVADKNSVSYKVQSGDSLYSIAKKYPGVSTDDLRKVNGLTSASIRPGQVLKIPVG